MLRQAIAVLLAMFGNCAIGHVSAQDHEQSLRRVGILAHRGDEAAMKRWQPTLDAVSEAISRNLEVVPLSLDGVRSSLADGEIDYLFTNPGHLFRLEEQFRLSPIAALRTDRAGVARTGNRFGAVIFVRSDRADITTLADLKGAKLAAVAPDAFGGFEIAADMLLRNGVDPWRDIASVAFLGFPQSAIVDAVLEGRADAGTVRTGILEAAINFGELEAEDVRILNPLRVPGFELSLSTVLVPEWIFSATDNVPEPERRDVAITLLRLPDHHPALKLGNYGGWTTVPSDAAVRRLLETVDAARDGGKGARQPPVSLYMLVIGSVFALAFLGWVWSRRRDSTSGEHREAPFAAEGVRLTPRESEILSLVATGMTTKEIARDLGISPKTVEFHRSHLMRKYEAHNMAELIRKASNAIS
ncbi:PhnD/SsuA/transferrin family substrate-binding protein [Oricola cellulosilytica]|uniref:HTH luxR-type domain-containing protein n=1 Tax=Oricola cellulosilytica TaxID=1429082 RepID=A0A4R0PJW4_9HYPH|nr:PhnD/SsuA/transferrin family substrate-binding protein [Oricola cellulosilytica]TCD16630.1 hypothetical protein E0D97_04240 [Oricola cellulosilytica]